MCGFPLGASHGACCWHCCTALCKAAVCKAAAQRLLSGLLGALLLSRHPLSAHPPLCVQLPEGGRSAFEPHASDLTAEQRQQHMSRQASQQEALLRQVSHSSSQSQLWHHSQPGSQQALGQEAAEAERQGTPAQQPVVTPSQPQLQPLQ